MKKVFVLLVIAFATASCGSISTKLITTSTYSRATAPMLISPVLADLEVSPEKINYYLVVKDNVRLGGEENVVSTAVKEALDVFGGDVLVGLEKQLKYDDKGEIVSISISGYPAKYVNFRPCEDMSLITMPNAETEKSGGILGIKK